MPRTRRSSFPHRYGKDGWFDFGPMPMELPTWLWWYSREPGDLERLRRLMSVQPESPTAVKPFRDKAEGGHDMPWLSFLAGDNPDYPERALSMALGQVARRVRAHGDRGRPTRRPCTSTSGSAFSRW